MAAKACFLQVKAFGDLVIAATAAERVVEADRPRLTLAIGRHLRPLCDAVAPVVEVVDLDTVETGVPSIFDVRRNGVPAAIRSAWRLRRAVARAPVAGDALLFFDRLGPRERFVSAGRPATGMPADVPNIYEGYDRLLAEAGFGLLPTAPREARGRTRAGIFPGSRIAAKNLPAGLVADLLAEAGRRGVLATLFLLDGERPDLQAGHLPHVVVPRRFEALRDAIASTDRVISADSLPAHMAERLGIASFVLTPRPNPFWMPRTVLADRRWSLFDDPGRLDRVGAMLAS